MTGDLLDLAQQMAAHQHGCAAARGQLAQEAAHADDALGVEAIARLVEQQDRRRTQHRARQTQALAHAERIVGHASVPMLAQAG